MPSKSRSISFSSAAQTTAFAQDLARHLTGGDVILLSGEIGAGKTHFARSLITALLPYPEDIPSPTFTLVQSYDTERFEIWHADLYRLTSPDEVVELGLVDAFTDALCLVEWPDRLEELAPYSALSLSFQMTETIGERQATMTWTDAKWDAKLKDTICD